MDCSNSGSIVRPPRNPGRFKGRNHSSHATMYSDEAKSKQSLLPVRLEISGCIIWPCTIHAVSNHNLLVTEYFYVCCLVYPLTLLRSARRCLVCSVLVFFSLCTRVFRTCIII